MDSKHIVIKGLHCTITRVKVFRIIPVFRIIEKSLHGILLHGLISLPDAMSYDKQ